MSHLSLTLLGPLQITLDGRLVTGLTSAKVQALLVYLAVEARRPHRREALAGLLWPDCSDRDALARLRSILFELRRAIGDPHVTPPFLLITRESIQLNPDGDYSLDVAEFERLARSSDLPAPPYLSGSAPEDVAAVVHRLQSAVDLYRGCFLEEFPASGSVPFEEWALLKREQIDRQMLAALDRLAALHETRGESAEAQACARRQIELAPWEERAHRQLMRGLALSGQRNAALVHYTTYRRRLAAELAAEPADETTALYQHIRDGTLKAPDMAIERGTAGHLSLAPASPPSVTSSPFVARERELAQLEGYLAQAVAGAGRVAFVTGEAGSGKTALLAEFSERAMAMHADLVVASGRCNAHSGIGDPYLPFREILHLLSGDVEARRAGGTISDEHARRLWAVLPRTVQALVDKGPDLIGLFVPGAGLLTRAEAMSPGSAAGAECLTRLAEIVGRNAAIRRAGGTAQGDLFDQVTRVLQAVARQQPLILVLDDLQWADKASVSLLFHLGRRLAGSRILVVGAYRSDTIGARQQGGRHPLEPVIYELQRDYGDVEVDLSQAESRQFVDALLDTEPNLLGAAFRELLYHHTGGLPLFTVELLRGLEERGDLVRDEAGRWVEGPALDWERLPARVEAVIDERLGRLPEDWRSLLAAASVEGEEFTAEVIANVQGISATEVIRCLSGALRKQHRLVSAQSLVGLSTRRLSRYRFRHYLFQRYLYQQLDPVERTQLHEAVGSTLEALYGDQAGEKAVELARHFEEAGMPGRAVHYLHEAATRAVRLSADAEAVALLNHGLELLKRLPDSPERAQQEFAMQAALATPLVSIHGWGSYERARALARAYELSVLVDDTARLFDLMYHKATLCSARGEEDQAVDLARQALDLARRDQHRLRLARAHMLLGSIRLIRAEFPEARDDLEHALALFDACLCDLPRSDFAVESLGMPVECLVWSCGALWALGYPDQALRRSVDALSRARELQHPFTLSFTLAIAGSLLRLLRREYPAAHEHADSLLDFATRDRLPAFQAWATILQGWWLAEQGQAHAGIARIREGLVGWEAAGNIAGQPDHRMLLAAACARAGRAEEALRVVGETLSLVKHTGLRFCEPELYRLKGELLLGGDGQSPGSSDRGPGDGGRKLDRDRRQPVTVEAEACFLKAIEVARRQGARSWELRATTSLCRLWQRQGRSEEARRMLAEICGWFTEGFDTADLQDAQALLEDSHKTPRASCSS